MKAPGSRPMLPKLTGTGLEAFASSIGTELTFRQ